jgi:hypothetical protein
LLRRLHLIWLVFFRLKLLPFNWVFGTASALVGLAIVLVFAALLSHLTPAGKIEIMGKVNKVTPNVAASSEIDGENAAVAQLKAQLDYANWELDQTTVRAPADGYVTASTVTIGDRAAPTKSVMSFIVADETR